MSDINTDILCRLERLEKQNRRLRRGLIGMVLGVVVLLTVAWSGAMNEIYRGQFFLLSDSGELKGGITVTSTGYPGLVLFKDKKDFVSNPEKPKNAIFIGYSDNGNPNIYIYDKNGNAEFAAVER